MRIANFSINSFVMNQLPTLSFKHFSEVFQVDQTKMGEQITALIKVEIGEAYLDRNISVINTDIEVNSVPILELKNKYLTGIWLETVSTFRIMGFQDEVSQG